MTRHDAAPAAPPLQEPWRARLARMLVQSVQSGLLSPRQAARAMSALPAIEQMLWRQGLGVQMLHALWGELTPERVALSDARRALTYRQTDDEINRLSNGLHTCCAVRERTPVGLLMANRVEYLIGWVALLRRRAWTIHLSYRLTSHELAHQLRLAHVRVVLVDAPRLSLLEETIAQHALDIQIVCLDADASSPHLSYAQVLERGEPSLPTRPPHAQSANVVYTSGTTGKAKGAMRDFTSFGLVELTRLIERLPLRQGDRHLIVAPLYHSAAQAVALLCLALGCEIHIHDHFDAEETLRAISEREINSLFLVPTMLQRLLDLPPQTHARFPTPALRVLLVGAAPFPHALRQRAIVRFGASHVFDFYGATEIGWVTLIRGDEMLARPGSVGRAIAGQTVRITDASGAPLPAGSVGQVEVASAQRMQGYLSDKADESDSSPFIGVEDLGRLDEQGYLYIEGRARDMVISGGVNLYPVEIEACLLAHPQVSDCAVLGLPDAQWGERLVALIVPRTPDVLDEEALSAHVLAHLSRHKLPRQWHLVQEIPRNPTGKILKNVLRDQLLATLDDDA